MPSRPHRPVREVRRALTALALTLSVFAVPLWTVAAHEPNTELFTPAPPSDSNRVAHFVLTLPPAPEPIPKSNEEVDAEADAAASTQVDAQETPEPETLPEPRTPAPPVASTPVELKKTPLPPATPRTRLPAPPPQTRVSTARSTSRKKRNCRPNVPEIKPATGRDDYSIERAFIDRYAKDLKAAARLAHVNWARDDTDRIIGFKVVHIRCGSPLHKAGFQNGDTITRINGHKVRTVPQAMAAYVALRVKRKLRVRGHRKDGAEMDLRYRLS